MTLEPTIQLLSVEELLANYREERTRRNASQERMRCSLCRRELATERRDFPEAVCAACEIEVNNWGWEEICECEPLISELLKSAQSVKDNGLEEGFCANRLWFSFYAPQIKQLVGFVARNVALRNSRCYELAYTKAYCALPPCRNCNCFLWSGVKTSALESDKVFRQR